MDVKAVLGKEYGGKLDLPTSVSPAKAGVSMAM